MNILGIGGYNALGDMYWRLEQGGHEVRVYVEHEEAHGIFRGMLKRTTEWHKDLGWIRNAGDEGLIIFEMATEGAVQEQLRREGFNVVGGSATGNRLELDRAFGQAAMREAGMKVAGTKEFSDFGAACDFVAARPRRYVFKTNDAEAASCRNYVGELDDGADLQALLLREQRLAVPGTSPSFVLMDYVSGVEVGVGGYFNGRSFLQPVCLDWEHKRFFPGDLGELTGEMGTVVTYRGYERLFAQTLNRMVPFLQTAGYRGYINLNTIVNAEGIWPLEFTCRFGYPGFAICDALHVEGWADILQMMALGRSGSFPTHPGFAVGVVLTVPPFPHEYGYAELSRGTPIFLRDDMQAANVDLHFGEAGLEDGQLVAAGSLGYLAVATGRGPDVPAAQAEAYRVARQVVARNMRYRNDIGDRFVRQDQALLQSWGYLD